jgi:hypothetical protein
LSFVWSFFWIKNDRVFFCLVNYCPLNNDAIILMSFDCTSTTTHTERKKKNKLLVFCLFVIIILLVCKILRKWQQQCLLIV